jgi:DNA-binding NarL/FixJ family response regulator
MAVVACVIDDVDLRTRLARIVSMRPGTTVVESDCSPAAVRTALVGTQITAALLCPLALPRFLEMRVALNVSSGIGREPRIVIAAPNVDSAYVYRAFSFGANDVIDISRNDGHVAESLNAALSGGRPAYAAYLVGEVDTQGDVTSLRIDYADEVDRRIVPMIVAGYTDREIADILHFSHQAVRNRISRLLMRSGIRNRTQLASAFLVGRLEGDDQP